MCSDPVTFGGGITIENRGASRDGSAVKYPAFSQNSYRGPSTSPGVYCDGRLIELVTTGESIESAGLPHTLAYVWPVPAQRVRAFGPVSGRCIGEQPARVGGGFRGVVPPG